MRKVMLPVAQLAVVVLLTITLTLWLAKLATPTQPANFQERMQELDRSPAADPLRALTARVKALEVRLQDPAKLTASPTLTDQAAAAEIEAQRSRIELLENATDENSFHSLASRLKAIELKLRDEPRPVVTPSPTPSRDTEHLRQGIDDLQRSMRDLAIRIKSLEDDRPRAGGGGFANDWQDLRRAVDDLKVRLTQLERGR
ncbi:MAG: hypothetical protein ACM359_16175 [Bacillota bacterium]